MANIVKQVAIFNKDQNSGMGSWETKDIGALASNISLVTPIGGNSNVEDVLHQVLPNSGLSSGFIEATEGGQLKTSNMSDDINSLTDELNSLLTDEQFKNVEPEEEDFKYIKPISNSPVKEADIRKPVNIQHQRPANINNGQNASSNSTSSGEDDYDPYSNF